MTPKERNLTHQQVLRAVLYDPELKQFSNKKTSRVYQGDKINIGKVRVVAWRLAHFYLTEHWPGENETFKTLENHVPKRTQSGVIHRIEGGTIINRPKSLFPVFGKSE